MPIPSANISQLIHSLDTGSGQQTHPTEDTLVQMGEEAVDELLQSVNEIVHRLLEGADSEANMQQLERRVRVLGRIASPKGIPAIMSALADSADAIANFTFVIKQARQQVTNPMANPMGVSEVTMMAEVKRSIAKSLNRTATDALVNIGEPVVPLLRNHLAGDYPPAVLKSLRQVLNRIEGKWWRFW